MVSTLAPDEKEVARIEAVFRADEAKTQQLAQEKQEAAFRAQECKETSRGGVHTLKWELPELSVSVSKLREQSNGDLRGDFDLRGDMPLKGARFEYFTRINLKSGQTRAIDR